MARPPHVGGRRGTRRGGDALLLKAGADFRTLLPDSGFTPMLFAVRAGRLGGLSASRSRRAPTSVRRCSRRSPQTRGRAKALVAAVLAVENGHFELLWNLSAPARIPTTSVPASPPCTP